MDTKALKKQMGAAIAMVLVAAVALGSATFAWFVTNSKVDATTSTISAQSNAAFMYIREKTTDSQDLTTWTSTVDPAIGDKALFPLTGLLRAKAAPMQASIMKLLVSSIRHSAKALTMAPWMASRLPSAIPRKP